MNDFNLANFAFAAPQRHNWSSLIDKDDEWASAQKKKWNALKTRIRIYRQHFSFRRCKIHAKRAIRKIIFSTNPPPPPFCTALQSDSGEHLAEYFFNWNWRSDPFLRIIQFSLRGEKWSQRRRLLGSCLACHRIANGKKFAEMRIAAHLCAVWICAEAKHHLSVLG